jgi:hypothetical protein
VPIVTTRDAEKRRIHVTVSDPWSAEEIAVTLEHQLTDRLWKYGTLYDVRGASVIPSEPDVLWLVKQAQQHVARHGAPGPVAVLIESSVKGKQLQQYAEYAAVQSRMQVRVFLDEAEANAWLDDTLTNE